MKRLLHHIQHARKSGEKLFAVLIDPDKVTASDLPQLVQRSVESHVDLFLVGSSLLLHQRLEEIVASLKSLSEIPVVLFPGDPTQVTAEADALLLLSLISGRNPELLIGNHVQAAARLIHSGLEIVPTGYILVDGGKPTSVSYLSNTQPIPANKVDIALATAMAGQLLGMQMIYLEAGSGAVDQVPPIMIERIREHIDIPIIVGGGIRTAPQAAKAVAAGADVVVVGTAIEHNLDCMSEMSLAIHAHQKAHINK